MSDELAGGLRRSTVFDVARLAGVSAMTVSRVINSPERVRPSTASRVQDAIEAARYLPNLLACGLKSGRSRTVAAVVPALGSPVFSATIDALSGALGKSGYHLMVSQGGYGPGRARELLRALMGRRPDGLVLVGVEHTFATRQLLEGAGLPIVETWDLTSAPLDMLVGFSHAHAGAAVFRHLHMKGRRSLAVITASNERAMRRANAFIAAARGEALRTPALVRVDAPATMGSGRKALLDLLARRSDIDGIFCSSDMLALGVLIQAACMGIEVPGQIGIVGFGDLEIARDTHPPLTSVRIDGQRIGEEAARCIVHRLDGSDHTRSPPPLDVGFSIVERGSG